MQKIKIAAFLAMGFFCQSAFSQDDLLKDLDTIAPQETTQATFIGLQICNMQSTKMPAKKELYAVISHRFGDLQYGFNNFFGLDEAVTKLGMIYGVTDWLSLAASRHTYHKLYELTAKYRLAAQEENGFPVTIAGYNTWDINSELDKEVYPGLKASHRYAFSSQLLISRKLGERVSLELAPVYVHKNLYEPGQENKDQFVLAAGGRCKITKRMSLNLEYGARFNSPETVIYKNPLAVGLDIDTGGHIFQLVFSNSQAMNDVSYFTNAAGDWNTRSIFFGFNLYRVF